MRDPLLVSNSEESRLPVFYRENPRADWPSWSEPRGIKQLQEDLNVAHTNLRKQVTINDSLISVQLWQRAQLERERKWRWGIFSAVSLTGAKILFPLLLSLLLSR